MPAFYILLSLASIVAVASVITLNEILIALSAFLLLIIVSFFKLWYVIEAFVFRHSSLIQVFAGYELSGERTSAIRKVNGKVSATTAAMLDVGIGNEVDKARLENTIAHINYPFKLIMQVERLDIEKILDNLQTKRNTKEIELSRLDGASNKHLATISRIKREIEQIGHDISNIKSGEMPLRLAYYIMTSSISDSVFASEERAKSQIRELSSQFDALLKASSRILSGDELLALLELDSSMVLS